MTGAPPAPGHERGFVTVAVVGLAAVLLAVGALVVTLGAVAVARHRAAAAADLGALAAARHLVSGDACAAASRVVRAQSAVLLACEVTGERVVVTTGVTVAGLGTARARAAAGPVSGVTAELEGSGERLLEKCGCPAETYSTDKPGYARAKPGGFRSTA